MNSAEPSLRCGVMTSLKFYLSEHTITVDLAIDDILEIQHIYLLVHVHNISGRIHKTL